MYLPASRGLLEGGPASDGIVGAVFEEVDASDIDAIKRGEESASDGMARPNRRSVQGEFGMSVVVGVAKLISTPVEAVSREYVIDRKVVSVLVDESA